MSPFKEVHKRVPLALLLTTSLWMYSTHSSRVGLL